VVCFGAATETAWLPRTVNVKDDLGEACIVEPSRLDARHPIRAA
jgi:hypothetical protein